MGKEFYRLPDECCPPPAEWTLPAEAAAPAPEYPEMRPEERDNPAEFIDMTPAPAGAGDTDSDDTVTRIRRRQRVLRSITAPVAATIAVVAVVFASFNFDPLGNDFLRNDLRYGAPTIVNTEAGEKNSKPDPTPTSTPTPTPTPALSQYPEGTFPDAVVKTLTVIHAVNSNGDTFESSLSEGVPTDELHAWLDTWGGNHDVIQELSRNRVFLGYEFSEDAIPVGDTDDPENMYIAQGTVYAVYREDIYYDTFLDSRSPFGVDYGDDSIPVLPNLAPDFAGAYAWSGLGGEEYVSMWIEGESEPRYLEMGSVWGMYGGKLADVPGASYDSSTNTLTLTDCTAAAIDCNLMGNGFTLNLIGDNHIGYIKMWGAGYAGSITITGTGTLTVNESKNAAVGLLINAEWCPSALIVDNGVKVDIYGGDKAVVVSGTSLEKAIWFPRGTVMTGGERANGQFVDYVKTVQNDDGTVSNVSVTLEEISAELGEDYYDYSVVDEDGNPVTEVHFNPVE